MPKRHPHKSFKSFIQSHITLENDEELKESKAEVESKILKALELLRANGKEPLSELIESFYSEYQSLFARYDHLIGQLREKVNDKKTKESSSSSSCSDSDSDSGSALRKKNSRNGNTEHEFDKMKEQLEGAQSEVADLRSKLTVALEENEALNLKCQGSVRDVQEAEKIIKDLTASTERWEHEKSKLLAENADLSLKLESSGKLEAELNQKLEEIEGQKNCLIMKKEAGFEERIGNKQQELSETYEEMERMENKISEMETALIEKESELSIVQKRIEVQEIEAAAQVAALSQQVSTLQGQLDSVCSQKIELESLLEDKSREISEYHVQIGDLKEEIASKSADGKRMLEEIEVSTLKAKDLDMELESFRKLKSELEKHTLKKNDEINQLIEEEGSLQIRFSELEKTLADEGDELSVLHKKLEAVERETSSEVVALNEQIDKLHRHIDSLVAEKNQLEAQISRLNQESVESLAQAENHEAELANITAEYEQKMNEQGDAFTKLREEHKHLEVSFNECNQNLSVAKKKVEEMKAKLQKEIDAKDRRIDEMEETIEDLRRDLETKADEINTLVDYVRTIEVKLRLSNQKLRVTEQLLTERDEDYKSKEEKLQLEKMSLEEKIVTLSEIVATYKETQLRMVTDISEKVSDTLKGMNSLNMRFEEDYGHLESRIHEILNELKVASIWIKEANCEKQLLQNEVTNLARQLETEKEQELILQNKVEELQTTLSKEENRLNSLTESVKRQEEKMGRLQGMVQGKDERIQKLDAMIKEKDLAISGLGEEKREVIRQLCIAIDYNRSRYDDLRETFSKITGGRRQITA